MSVQKLRGRETSLGSLPIWRALPVRERRLVGRWCFLDRYGPISFTDTKPMDVAPHPHIGIQTVSWLIEGEVIHHDSLGFEAVARPGGVNVMTSGSGIAHSEETPRANEGRLNGVQLWIAQPDATRNGPASFAHVPEVPRDEHRGGIAQRFVDEEDLIGVDAAVHRGETLQLPLRDSHEHGVFVLGGDVVLEGQSLDANSLYYLGSGRGEVALRSASGARVLVIGGEPFAEPVLMWWNFVARTPEEIAAARADWQEGRRFGGVEAYDGPRIEAPSLGRLAQPNPAS